MERVIKFKVWQKSRKRMLWQEGSNIFRTGANTFEIAVWVIEVTGQREPPPYDDFIYLQYIEKNDNKGKEIYDGDIISCWLTSPWDEEHIIEVIGIIEFLNGGWWFSTGCIEYNGYYEYDGKIIGNKFENPELFNKKQ